MTTTRIAFVVSAGKLIFRHTRLLPVMLPPGTVAQVRSCAAELIRVAKRRGFVLMLVGHVTKEGQIAGPRVLEHMVDTVLYFEGERGHQFRILRSVKNRFGPANEIGVFQLPRIHRPSLRRFAEEVIPHIR